jgi:hypothetical protein
MLPPIHNLRTLLHFRLADFFTKQLAYLHAEEGEYEDEEEEKEEKGEDGAHGAEQGDHQVPQGRPVPTDQVFILLHLTL